MHHSLRKWYLSYYLISSSSNVTDRAYAGVDQRRSASLFQIRQVPPLGARQAWRSASADANAPFPLIIVVGRPLGYGRHQERPPQGLLDALAKLFRRIKKWRTPDRLYNRPGVPARQALGRASSAEVAWRPSDAKVGRLRVTRCHSSSRWQLCLSGRYSLAERSIN